MTDPAAPLDTPPDWHDRIARRAAEYAADPEKAIRDWHARGEMSRAVQDVALAELAARRASEAASKDRL